MAGNKCKCGEGIYKKSLEKPDGSTEWTCNSCGRTYSKRPYPKEQNKTTHNFSNLEIGKGVAEYLIYLESELSLYKKKVKEAEDCFKERDLLQSQISEMQQKYNQAALERSAKIPSKFLV